LQPHPLYPKTACRLSRQITIPAFKKTALKMRVSHHPHGDWQLRVLVNGKVLSDQIVGSKTVGKNEWLDVAVDLSRFAGQTVKIVIENHPNNWANEWAYWNRVELSSKD
ncbi:MAG: hypothetical protein P8M80_11660, partial [Pirellulaceae bacterium]|nr:hypothetical protein [Pirellulaceae bacterium]